MVTYCEANLTMHHTKGDEFTLTREGKAELFCKDGLKVWEVTTD